jgi:L-threonylcarbamoyladenylate synthase
MMKSVIEKAISYLAEAKTILCPTDTIWGISCDATSFEAIEDIYLLKKRDKAKSLIVLVSSLEMLQEYVESVSLEALVIILETKDPLTVIYSNPKNLPKNSLAGDGSIAIRWVKQGFCNALISAFGKPIISSSANFSNEKTALTFTDIDNNFKEQVDFIVDEKFESSNHKSSKIIKLLSKEIIVIRD